MPKIYLSFLGLGLIVFVAADHFIRNDYPVTRGYREKFIVKELEKIKLLAEKGDPESQNKVGWMYDQGIGFREDAKEAFKWYLKSANQGFYQAKINLGVMYELGRGVPQNFNQAEKWYSSEAQNETDLLSLAALL
tara:strand:+ start:2253 stop:2657 length:405 start_codon:yes stop_codon:yes gene_type:complete